MEKQPPLFEYEEPKPKTIETMTVGELLAILVEVRSEMAECQGVIDEIQDELELRACRLDVENGAIAD